MTLRARLVVALGVLLIAGLAIFGVATTSTYARTQYRRLDDQLRSSIPFVERDLYEEAGLSDGRDGGPDHGPGPDGDGSSKGDGPEPPVVIPSGTYAELRDGTGAVLARVQIADSDAQPAIPDPLPLPDEVVTVGSSAGSGRWRLVARESGRGDTTVIAAAPTGEVARSLRRLVTIEALASLGLLTALTGGAWLILRRGLRPLESMAGAAREISAGDLSHRVSPADGRSEVGQLGLALNTMLEGIEDAFRERDATEERLRRFLADASHELRTPLTSIQGFAELFRLGTDNPNLDLPVVMRRIEQEAARMRALVDDLLLLARMDQTRPLQRRPVDLAVLVADACTDASAVDPSRPITLDAPTPVLVSGDDAHLRQAIANLVSNALRHTPAGTAIDVGVQRAGGEAVVTVADRGPGLPADVLPRVFDRFWQADAARTGAGAGLGLAIVAGVAGEHGGSATVANRDGGGARFTIRLPLDAPSRGVDATPEDVVKVT
jgi:two-component system OmpR family sensor kinase